MISYDSLKICKPAESSIFFGTIFFNLPYMTMDERLFMQIDETLLQRLEKLSYLQIPEDQREEMIAQLSEIVSFVDNLSELSTEGIDPTFAMNAAATRLRDDTAYAQRAVNDDIMAHAPKAKDHFFIVPKIIE